MTPAKPASPGEVDAGAGGEERDQDHGVRDAPLPACRVAGGRGLGGIRVGGGCLRGVAAVPCSRPRWVTAAAVVFAAAPAHADAKAGDGRVGLSVRGKGCA